MKRIHLESFVDDEPLSSTSGTMCKEGRLDSTTIINWDTSSGHLKIGWVLGEHSLGDRYAHIINADHNYFGNNYTIKLRVEEE